MPDDFETIKRQCLEEMLKNAVFDGWTVALFNQTPKARLVFPDGLKEVEAFYFDEMNRHMMERLAEINPETLRVRERIHQAVMIWLESQHPYHAVLQDMLSRRVLTALPGTGCKILWGTSDHIWVWAGDTSKDYNHYTKRGLLSGVIATTLLAWIGQKNNDLSDVETFLSRRIENVLRIGQFMAKFMPKSEAKA